MVLSQFESDLQKYADNIRLLLYKVIRKQLYDISEKERICIALSGGIDSIVVAHLIKQSCKNKLVAFTLHVDGNNSEERDIDHAIEVAKALSIEHKIIYVLPKQVIDAALPVMKMITPPGRNVRDFNIYSGIVTYLLGSEIKKEGIQICFGGEGFDELSGSYGPSGSFTKTHEEMTSIEMRNKLYANLTKNGYLDRTTKTLGAFEIEARSPFIDDEFKELMLNIPSEFFNQEHGKLPLIKAFSGEIAFDLTRKKVRAQVGSGVFDTLQRAGINQQKLEEMFTA